MRKIAALKVEYEFANAVDSEARLDRFYEWLINKAIDNLLLDNKAVDNNSTPKYISGYEQSGSISDTRRSSRDVKAEENNNIPDVQGG